MINKIFKNRYFITSIQFFTLFVFVAIIYSAIGVFTDDAAFAKVLRNTNLPNLIIWSYWWPIIISTAIIFGRYWCTVCPMELITSFFAKIGLRRKPGKILKSGWIITLFYAIILIVGIHSLAIHRIPQYMAIYMLILFAVAVIVGLIWEKRTFCTYVCPIGHLLGLYSMLSSKKLRVKDKSVCESCDTKSCISKSNHYNFIGRSCTSELYPATLKDNKDCILCGQCFKSCSYDNIAIKKQRIAADLFNNVKLSWAEIGFFFIVSSFVIYEILSEWEVTKSVLMTVPKLVNNGLDIPSGFTGTVKALILFIIFPVIFYFFFALLKRYLAKENIKTALIQLVTAILPITASMHLLKAVLKTTSRIPYWQYATSDPNGVKYAEDIMADKSLLKSDLLSNFINPAIDYFAIIIIVAGLVLSFYIIKNQKFEKNISKYISVLALLIYFTLFLTSLIYWRFL